MCHKMCEFIHLLNVKKIPFLAKPITCGALVVDSMNGVVIGDDENTGGAISFIVGVENCGVVTFCIHILCKYRSITIANVDVTTGGCIEECGTVIFFIGTVGNRVGDTKPLCIWVKSISFKFETFHFKARYILEIYYLWILEYQKMEFILMIGGF